MKKLTSLLLLSLALSAPAFAGNLSSLERQVYGHEGLGPQTNRLEKLERDLFGRALPGESSTRERSLEDFINKSGDSPSLTYKTDMISWALGDGDSFLQPLSSRVASLEGYSGQEVLNGKPIAMRLERLMSGAFSSELTPQPTTVPAGTVVRLALVTPLGAGTPAGSPFIAQTTSDLVLNGQSLIAPRGSLVKGTVKSTKAQGGLKPSFAVTVALEGLQALGDAPLPLAQSDGTENQLTLKGSGTGINAGSTLLLQVARDSSSNAFLVNNESIKAFRARYAERPQSFKTPEYAQVKEEVPVQEPVVKTTTDDQGDDRFEGWSIKDAFYFQGKDGKPVYPKDLERKIDESRREKTDPKPEEKDDGDVGSQEYQWL